jgi:hypothetical protein
VSAKIKNKTKSGCPLDVTKVLFLDIDGVINPYGNGHHFEHIMDGDMPKVYNELKELHGVDYSKYYESNVAIVYYDWSKDAIQFLKDILTETGAKIVLSSDWRDLGFETMYDFFKMYDLHKFFIDTTYEIKREVYKIYQEKYKSSICLNIRTIEILEYIRKYPHITHYVAIDDLDLSFGLENHFIMTDEDSHYLLDKRIAEKAIKILTV